jgi:ribosomal protein L1
MKLLKSNTSTYNLVEALTFLKQSSTTKKPLLLNLAYKSSKSKLQPLQIVSNLPTAVEKKQSLAVLADFSLKDSITKEGGIFVNPENLTEFFESGIKATKIDYFIVENKYFGSLKPYIKTLVKLKLLPTTKAKTLTTNPLQALKFYSMGQTLIKVNKHGATNVVFGLSTFSVLSLIQNVSFILKTINLNKPKDLKLKKGYVSIMNGPSFTLFKS